jgi:DNA-directed RNA polymerase specialized sigma subunit
MIRQTILDLFRRNKSLPSLQEIAAEIGITTQDVALALSTQPRFDNLAAVSDLSMEQLYELLDFYGPNTMFTEDISDNVRGFIATRQKIKRIEEKKRKTSE